jgi:hypothetical protein
VRLACVHADILPVVTVGLVNDTAPTGPGSAPYLTDLLTNDPRVQGTTDDDEGVVKLEAKVDNGAFVDITSTLQNGHYQWNPGTLSHGTHQITIRATDTANQTNNAVLNFRVNTPPVANAGGNHTVGEGSTVTFDATGSTDTEAALFSYLWTLPDGSTSTDLHPSYHFVQDGTYTATLQVTDTAGSVTSATSIVTVNNLPAVVAPLDDQTINLGDSFSFQTGFIDPGVLDTHSGVVDWGDMSGMGYDATIEEQNGTGTASGQYYYMAPGLYTVTDNGGATGSTTFHVHVIDVTPNPIISGASTVNEGSTYTLSLNSNGATGITGWTITWGDGTISTLSGNPTSTTHVYLDGPHDYFINATDTNGTGTYNSNTQAVTVNNVAPSVSANNLSGNEGQSLSFSGSFTDPGVLDTHTATIDWGDGSAVTNGTISETNGSGTIVASHRYADNGTYTLHLSVKDKDGATTSQTATATISNVAPTATASANQNEIRGIAFVLQVGTFSDPGFTPSYGGSQETFAPNTTIDWGDGSPLDHPTPAVNNGSPGTPTTGSVTGTHTYSIVGDYLVTVRVVDDDGGAGTATFTIHVLAHGSNKFLVTDQDAHSIFYYDVIGNYNNQTNNAASDSRPRGIASNAAADTFWVVVATQNINNDKNVFVYNADGTLRGSWTALGFKQPQDIATNGTDIWIVDDASMKIYRYGGAASFLDGTHQPTQIFSLDRSNKNASGLVTDGQYLWVTDEGAQAGKVFVYDLNGRPLGSWLLDPINNAPSGITLNPHGGNDLWVVDRNDAVVYRYANSKDWLSGNHTATDSFVLNSANHHPEGIADPEIVVQSPSDGSRPTAPATVLITGQAQRD